MEKREALERHQIAVYLVALVLGIAAGPALAEQGRELSESGERGTSI